jgi:hypothetical protein
MQYAKAGPGFARPAATAYHGAMSVLPRLLLPLLLALLLPACQTLKERDDAQKLQHTLDSYGAAVRWEPLAGLYGYLTPDLQPETVPDGLRNVRVTGYEVSVPPRRLADDRVVQTAIIQYVHVDRQVLQTLVDRQLWTRDDEGQWLRANPIPVFK